MDPIIVVGAMGVVALAGLIALAWFAWRGAEHRGRGALLIGGFAAAVLALFVAIDLVAIFGMEVVWVALAVLLFAAVVALFFFAGREVKWVPTRVLSLVGLGLMCMVLTFAVGMALGGSIAPMKAQQIAKKQGFVVLLPAWVPATEDVEGLINVPPGGAPLGLEWIDPNEPPDAGVWLGYSGLDIYQRKTGTGLSLAQLESKIPTDAVKTQVTVQGKPALLAEYVDKNENPNPTGQVRVLVFETGGVTVNMRGLTREQLLKVAESLKPSP